jgi:teichuronic acid biosynthesis glycosyltransferase TuaH
LTASYEIGLHPHALVLSTADWDRPLWTNKQYVARELASVGPVTYINSLGLRQPELSRDDLRRILRRFGRRAAQGTNRHIIEGVEVISPWIIPWHREGAPIWRLNQVSLRRSVRHWRRNTDMPRLLWTFSPVTYGLEGYADMVVYHCVDLLEQLHGVDRVALRQGEATLSRLPTIVPIASSRTIGDHLVGRGFSKVLLWENVADVEVIETHARNSQRRPGHIVFAGNLTLQKVDFGLLRGVVESDPSIHLNLAGPLAEGGGTHPDVTWFATHPRVEFHGTLEARALAALLGRCTVGLIPYRRSPYTDGVFPMKVYEYLAAGLAVVSTDLPALEGVDGVETYANTEGFVRSVRSHAQGCSESDASARIAIARSHSWATRSRQIRELLLQRLL